MHQSAVVCLKMTKAQMFSLDAVIAASVFMVIIITSAWAWTYTQEKIDLTEKRNDLEIISKNALACLVETPGYPANWTNISESDFNETNILSLGLARSFSINGVDLDEKRKSAGLSINNYLVLDKNKITKLVELNSQKYSTYKRILGILGPDYEFQLTIKVWDGSSYNTNHEIGLAPTYTASNILRADRFALLNGNWTNVVLNVWQECSGVTC